MATDDESTDGGVKNKSQPQSSTSQTFNSARFNSGRFNNTNFGNQTYGTNTSSNQNNFHSSSFTNQANFNIPPRTPQFNNTNNPPNMGGPSYYRPFTSAFGDHTGNNTYRRPPPRGPPTTSLPQSFRSYQSNAWKNL